jgi:hypothetical protein
MSLSKGVKYDGDKPDYSLVPFGALDEVVKVLTYGAKKYDRFNWEKVEDIRYQAAALRHISAYMQGETYDPETGINHMAHAACSLLFLTQFDLNASESEENPKQIEFNFDEGVYNSDEMIYNMPYEYENGDVTIQPTLADAYVSYTMNLNDGKS